MHSSVNRQGWQEREGGSFLAADSPGHPFARYLNGRGEDAAAGRIECSFSGRGTRIIHLTLIDDIDEQVLAERGLAFLRRLRIYRLTNEAEEQGCPLSYSDLHDLLLVSFSTLKRDIAGLRKQGLRVPLKRSIVKREKDGEAEQE